MTTSTCVAPCRVWSIAMMSLVLGACSTAPVKPPAEDAKQAVVDQKLEAQDFDTGMKRGDEAFLAADYDKAIFFYTQAAQLDPASDLPLLRMASIHEARKDREMLRRSLAEAIRRNPANAAAHEHLGFAFLRLDDTESASREFTESARLDASRWRAVMGLGLAASGRGNADAARLHFDTALRMQPRSAELLSYSAELHLQQGELDAGLVESRAALGINPNPATHLILGDLLARKLDYPGALEAYLAATKEPEAYQRLGEEAMRAKDYERALRYFRQSADASPTFNEQVQKRMAVARERLSEAKGSSKPPAGT